MAPTPQVVVHGLKETRRDLKAIDRTLPRELNNVIRAAAEPVRAEAARRAPRRSGRLASSIRLSASGNRVSLVSRLPYANPIHWGWRKHGIKANPFMERAAVARAADVGDRVADEVERFFERHGLG